MKCGFYACFVMRFYLIEARNDHANRGFFAPQRATRDACSMLQKNFAERALEAASSVHFEHKTHESVGSDSGRTPSQAPLHDTRSVNESLMSASAFIDADKKRAHARSAPSTAARVRGRAVL
jgi:hypothetical protein